MFDDDFVLLELWNVPLEARVVDGWKWRQDNLVRIDSLAQRMLQLGRRGASTRRSNGSGLVLGDVQALNHVISYSQVLFEFRHFVLFLEKGQKNNLNSLSLS